jgi:hypothetical protein
MPRESGVSSTLRPFDSIADAPCSAVIGIRDGDAARKVLCGPPPPPCEVRHIPQPPNPLKQGMEGHMNHSWIFDLYMFIVDVYFWFKQKPCPKPVPRIVGSVPYVPLEKK